MIEERTDDILEVVPLPRVHLGGDAQGQARAHGDVDGAGEALLGGGPAQESQVFPLLRPEPELVQGHAVRDGGHPVGPGEGSALGVRDGDQGDVGELPVQGLQLGQIEPAVQVATTGTPGCCRA